MDDDGCRGRLVCAICGDDLSEERVDEGESLDCSHCEELTDEQDKLRLFRVDANARWFRVN